VATNGNPGARFPGNVQIVKAGGGMKMEIKINNGKFFALEAGSEKFVTDTEKTAITKLQELVKSGSLKVKPEEVVIFEVDTLAKTKDGKTTWGITQVPWARIAMGLLGA
jgi:hypothetical protein